jgi:hypothetical protein
VSPHLLFQHVSTALFSPLAAPGAAFYSEVLLTLFTETQRHQEPLSRETALRIVLDLLEDLNAFDVTMNLEEDLSFEDDMERRRAGTVLRYLTRCYWLHEEIQRDFTIVYTLPDYAFRLLTVLYEIAHDTKPPLQGLICTIHDLLQAAVREGNESIRIPQAYRETLRLLNGLKELQHNIGVQIEIVLRQVEPRDVLEQTFGAYFMIQRARPITNFEPLIMFHAFDQVLTWLSLSLERILILPGLNSTHLLISRKLSSKFKLFSYILIRWIIFFKLLTHDTVNFLILLFAPLNVSSWLKVQLAVIFTLF